MGYQESLVLIRPHTAALGVVKRCERQRKSGYYGQNPCTVELGSVIVLKRRMHQYPAGTVFLWVTGDRCFHNMAGLLAPNTHSERFKLLFIPAESFFKDGQTEDICFNGDKPFSENGWFRRYSPDAFVKWLEKEVGAR